MVGVDKSPVATLSPEIIEKLGLYLKDETKPMKGRFRALFTLKSINTAESVDAISAAFNDCSALLKHELAYCLGQMQSEAAIKALESVIGNLEEHPMVRHEAGEALGAIGSKECENILMKYLKDPVDAVAETCKLAINRIRDVDDKGMDYISKFGTIDPAFSAPLSPRLQLDYQISRFRKALLDENIDLYIRYNCMFSLRDLAERDESAVFAICDGFSGKSALFRHEIAFVLGQLANSLSIPALKKQLEDTSEDEMVRHESAEALGAIGTVECVKILEEFKNDPSQVVKESCEIALDICEYQMTDEFQYANGLDIITVSQ